MKSKKNLYILLPTVLIVWGLVIYRFFKGVNPSVSHATIEQLNSFKPKQIEESKPFTVKLDYRDPFLGTVQRKQNLVIPRKTTVKKDTKPEAPFPAINYKGIITPKGRNSKVFLISINGQQHLFKINTSFNNVKLLKGNANEVTLQFQKQRQTFQLED